MLAPLTLFAALAFWGWLDIGRSARLQAERVPVAMAGYLHRVMNVQKQLLETTLTRISGRTAEELASDGKIHTFLSDISIGISAHLVILDTKSRRILASSRDASPQDCCPALLRDYLADAGHEGLVVGDVIDAGGEKGFTVSLDDPSSGIAAVSLLSLYDFIAFYEGLTQPKPDVIAVVVHEDGSVLVRSPALANPVGVRLSPASEFMQRLRGASRQLFSARSPIDGVERLWGSEKVEGYPIFVKFGVDLERLRADWLRGLAPRGLLALCFSAALLFLVSRWQQEASEAEAARLRTIASLSESLRIASKAARVGLHDFDAASGRRVWSPEMHEILGTDGKMLPISEVFSMVHPADRKRIEAEGEEIGRRIGPYEIECRILRPNGEVRWVLDRGEAQGPVDAETGKVARVIGTLIDITERKRREEQIGFLLREVNHRAKNLLSLVDAIASQTAAAKREDFAPRFRERIQSLAASLDVLVKGEWRKADLSELIRSQLAHFQDLIDTRIRLKGPELFVTASAAQTLGMVVHELATNAGKYGALSSADGQVDVEWTVEGGEGAELFKMSWRERGGPPVALPAAKGFGSTVTGQLARMGLDGEASTDYAAEGLSWRLSCPARNVLYSRAANGRPHAADSGGGKEAA